MECSWNDGDKTKYYIVIFDQLQGHSEGLIWAPESFVRGSWLCSGSGVSYSDNNNPSSTMDMSPFFANKGYYPSL